MTLTGTCACPGEFEGTLRHYKQGVTYTKHDAVVLPAWVTGDVINLKNAGALLSAKGGLTCHGSIVAREYRIPCMVGVKGVDEIPDGTHIKLDVAEEELKIFE